MPAPRRESRKHWPTGLYEPRKGYFIYKSTISGRTVAIGHDEKEAIDYAKWANEQVAAAEFEKKVGRVKRPHLGLDKRGLLEHSWIAERAMACIKIIGVYMLLMDAEIVYVGQSTNVLARIYSHQQRHAKDFNRFFIIECRPEDLLRTESLYIDKFNPRHNLTAPQIAEDEAIWSEDVRSLLGAAIHQQSGM